MIDRRQFYTLSVNQRLTNPTKINYNSLDNLENHSYNSEWRCFHAGKILTPIGILTFLFAIESIIGWYVWVYCCVVLALCIFAVIYVNGSKHFRK